MLDPLLTALLVGLPVLAGLVFLLGAISYRGMIGIRIKDDTHIKARILEKGDATAEQLALPWIPATIESPRGYPLALRFLEGTERRLAIFHHGVSWSWLGMIRYMAFFMDLGWTVIALDARGHGASGGGRPSYGVYERDDLGAVVDWALERFTGSESLVLVGESMGAAAVLQYAPGDPRVDAVVADCPFSSAVAELDHRLKRSFVPFFLRPLVVRAADLICRRREGFSLFDASPERAMLATSVPMLLVHGLDDDYVPWRMSVAMVERRRRALPDAITELRLVPGARHARSVSVDPVGYGEALGAFLSAALAAKEPRQ
jgi:alpha-beta hydrolase superfamily lysophospholipase